MNKTANGSKPCVWAVVVGYNMTPPALNVLTAFLMSSSCVIVCANLRKVSQSLETAQIFGLFFWGFPVQRVEHSRPAESLVRSDGAWRHAARDDLGQNIRGRSTAGHRKTLELSEIFQMFCYLCNIDRAFAAPAGSCRPGEWPRR